MLESCLFCGKRFSNNILHNDFLFNDFAMQCTTVGLHVLDSKWLVNNLAIHSSVVFIPMVDRYDWITFQSVWYLVPYWFVFIVARVWRRCAAVARTPISCWWELPMNCLLRRSPSRCSSKTWPNTSWHRPSVKLTI